MTRFEELAVAYWEHYRLSFHPSPQERLRAEEYEWAWLEASGAADEPDAEAVPMLCALADAAPSDEALAYLGAGPVEQLVNEHHAAVVDALEAAAQEHPKLATALRLAWFHASVPDDVATRLRESGRDSTR